MGFTIKHLDQFRHGHNFSFGGKGTNFGDVHVGGAGRAAFEEAWPIFRDEILHDWIRSEPRCGHGGPCTRPYAWWELDAPEPRRRTDGGPHPFANPARKEHCDRLCIPQDQQFLEKLYYGVPGNLVIEDDFQAEYESEREYLCRLNLLLPEEGELYAAAVAKEATKDKPAIAIEDMDW